MDKQILLIASKLLDQASEQFSNHGCNDLDAEVLKAITNETKLTEDVRKHFDDDGNFIESLPDAEEQEEEELVSQKEHKKFKITVNYTYKKSSDTEG